MNGMHDGERLTTEKFWWFDYSRSRRPVRWRYGADADLMCVEMVFYSTADAWPWLPLHNIFFLPFFFCLRSCCWTSLCGVVVCGCHSIIRNERHTHACLAYGYGVANVPTTKHIDLRVIFDFILAINFPVRCFRSKENLFQIWSHELTKIRFYGWTNKIQNNFCVCVYARMRGTKNEKKRRYQITIHSHIKTCIKYKWK